MVVVARNLWLGRNTLIHGGPTNLPTTIVGKALESWATFRITHDCHCIRAGVDTLRDPCWKVPSSGYFKVNCDAVVNIAKRNMGINVTVRDSAGKVLATLLASQNYIIEPAVAEASTALRDVVLCRERAWVAKG
jgi:hypothetical protein